MEDCLILDSVSYLANSTFPCNIANLIIEVFWCIIKIICCLLKPIKLFVENDSYIEEEGEEEEEDGLLPVGHCQRCSDKGELTYDDIKLAMRSIGMVDWRGEEVDQDGGAGKCKECRLMEGAYELMEDKKASLEELEEAFYVFDRNEDGFISPVELWSVMRRLGLKEGVKYEDCERMIRVFDNDGDGRISFHEFKSMMENVR
ncbi:calmodulin-like protein 3 [Typha angustifolia]|uniref:calmodulin-like protein 3 n=1 Tax=Typha angustifolia TaxID=59011 RepID=UPI003C2EAEFB